MMMTDPAAVHLYGEWADVKGLRIYALTATKQAPPDARAVICVHGMVISSRYMVPIAQRLAPTYRVYAPDLPGYGESAKPPQVLNVSSQADFLVDWMDAVGLNRASLLANSYGCQIATSMAARYPHRVECLVLTSPTTDPSRRTFRQQLMHWQVELLREPWHYIAMQVSDYAKAGIKRAGHTYQHMMADRIEDSLTQVQAPTLVVRGERDPIISEWWAEEAATLAPSGRFVSIPGTIHPVNYISPVELARIVTPFIDESHDQ